MAVPLSNLSARWAASASSVNTAIRMNVTDVASAANSKLIDLLVANTSKFSVDKNGNIVSTSLTANTLNVINATITNIISNTITANVSTSNTITTNSITSNIITVGVVASNTIAANVVTSNTVVANTITVDQISSVPTGALFPYAGNTEPTGFLFCTGNAISRTVYSRLFSAIGTTYGTGDGSTTFNLPDLRGRVIAGRDNMSGAAANRLTANVTGSTLGATGGVQSHTLTEAQMPAHHHLDGYSDDGGTPSYGTTTAGSADDMSFSGVSTRHPRTSTTGGGESHNNIQPTIVLNYIIKT